MALFKPENRSTVIQIILAAVAIGASIAAYLIHDWLTKASTIQSNTQRIEQLETDRGRIDRRMERLENKMDCAIGGVHYRYSPCGVPEE